MWSPNKTLLVIGFYYLITAIWPLLSIKTFEMITGPKVDKWLVYTVSCLLLGPSLLYIYSGLQNNNLSPLIDAGIQFILLGILLLNLRMI